MTEYILPHVIAHEEERLARLARMLDPQMRLRLQQLGVGPGWKCLELGAGNGSISEWLAGQVGPEGRVVVSDIDTKFIDRLADRGLEVRRIDATRDPLGEGYDLICGRAFLHHIPERRDVLARIRDALRPGGFVLVEEPDFHSVFAEENLAMRAFWEGFVAWAANQSIDYFVGRRLGLWLAELGFEAVDLRGETILSEGGSAISAFWKLTFEELSGPILASGMVAQADFDEAMRLFDTPGHWNWQCSFLIAAGQKPAS